MRSLPSGHPLPMRAWAMRRPDGRWGVALACLLGLASCNHSSEEPSNAVTEWSCADAELPEAPLRRLTRFEYSNIISDVFELDPDFTTILPRDEVALGFDNQAGALSITDLHVDAYLQAAYLVGESVRDAPKRVRALAGCSEETKACATQTCTELGRRLLRRPVSEREVQRLLELFEDDFSPEGFGEGLLRVVAALLQAPEFLYRVERSPRLPPATSSKTDTSERVEDSGPVLAARLAFLLWASSPDAPLLDAADNGELATRSGVEAQARRMLDDARAQRGLLHFFEQWLELSSLHEVEKDPRLFPIWDSEIREQLGEETRHFLRETLWQGDGRLETLLRAKHSYLTPRLMDFYELPITSKNEDEFVRIEFPEQAPRSGVLTQAALLSHLAKADQTSPIHRGKFVRERFFCTIPPPPPPDIVVAAPRLDPRKTTRERFEQHRSQPACAGCHELLDPIGLVFEHYDAIGRYRSHEADEPIDASGFLVETDVDGPVDGVDELTRSLAKSAEVERCVVTQWFRYAFGRGETAQDSCTLDKLQQQFAAADGDLLELVLALTQTDPFTRPAKAPPPEAEEAGP